MAGSHRAKKPGVWPGIVAAVAVVALIAVACIFLARALSGDDQASDSDRNDTSTSDSTSGSTSEGSTEADKTTDTASDSSDATSPSEGATKKPKSSKKPPFPKPETGELTQVSDSSPRRITVDGLMDRGFDIAVDDSGGQLLPASGDEVSRWADRGSPGSPGSDTVFLVGSTDAEDAFNGLPEMAKGTEIVVTTDLADLTYTVVATQSVTDPLSKKRIVADVPGRLVLLGTDGYGASADEPVQVVVANLTSVN